MKERFKPETQGLIRMWMRHDRGILGDYLVRGVEDPRINVQSILTRHFLIERLFGGHFTALEEQELRFSLVINWLLKLLKSSVHAGQIRAVLDALLEGKDQAESLNIPQYISETFVGLAVPNYICDLFCTSPVDTSEAPVPEYLMNTFQAIWSELLESEESEQISVLEPACGSANDYRFIEAFGMAQFLDYTGFDLCEKNIHNAKCMFSEVRFKVGNVLEIDAPEDAFDYCFVHDLFEHLSLEAMEVAIAQICRVTRRGICIGFFNMYGGDRHIVKTVGDYHWNKLSATVTKAIFEQHASVVQVIDIDAFLASRFGCSDTHNKGAYTFIVRM